MLFLCICICYEIENNSEIISICYARPHLNWAVIWGGGGAKRMGGGKRTRQRALPKMFEPLQKSWSALSWIFVQEKQSTDT